MRMATTLANAPVGIIENDTITVPASNYPNYNDHCPNAIRLELQTTTASQTSRIPTARYSDINSPHAS